jgi:1,2-dihydroxy-3-keto-5-methylthiopentene dioxygenase
MSRLRIFASDRPEQPLIATHDRSEMARALAVIGVDFEQWAANQPIQAGDAADAILAAYKTDIDRISAQRGFTTIDVVSIAPDNPNREEMRKKFLDEHFHKEDEVRFFVAGSGLFTLHVNDKVYEVLCEAGDLISVPDGTRHWFDMGPAPSFVAIRFFQQADGWVGHFTGTDIAQKFPRFEGRQTG